MFVQKIVVTQLFLLKVPTTAAINDRYVVRPLYAWIDTRTNDLKFLLCASGGHADGTMVPKGDAARKKGLWIVGQLREDAQVRSPPHVRHFGLWRELAGFIRAIRCQGNYSTMTAAPRQFFPAKQMGDDRATQQAQAPEHRRPHQAVVSAKNYAVPT